MCQYLEWELNIDPAMLKEFEDMVRKDYILPLTKKSTPPPYRLPPLLVASPHRRQTSNGAHRRICLHCRPHSVRPPSLTYSTVTVSLFILSNL